jgi:hypothetical protein
MSMFNLKTAALAIFAGVGLSGCAYGPYGGLGVGVGYGNGYNDPYYNSGGYYGSGYGYGYPYGAGYGYPYGSGYGYPYGGSYYGWNNGYYYPGTGYYVYDSYRRPHRWSDAQRRYWERQRSVATSTGGVSRVIENWADFQNGPQATTTANRTIRQRNVERPQRIIRERPVASSPQVRTEQRVQSPSMQQERREARAEARQERRGNRGQNRRVAKD